MPEHNTRNTESVTAWCNHCGKPTQHKVSDGRRGRCMEHEAVGASKKQEAAARKREHEEKNPKLF
jgi:hypothetical protein